MPTFHSSELREMSDMQRKKALDSVYEAALQNKRLLERLRSYSMRGQSLAATPTQTSCHISLDSEKLEFAGRTDISSL